MVTEILGNDSSLKIKTRVTINPIDVLNLSKILRKAVTGCPTKQSGFSYIFGII